MSTPNFTETKSLKSAESASPNGAVRISFDQLPKETQEKIIRLQSFQGEHFSQKLGSTYFQYLLLLIGLIWFVTLFIWARDALWSTAYTIVLAALTLIAAVVFIYGLYLVIRTQTSRLQPFVHVTPAHFIKTGYKTIEYRDLGLLRGITSDEVLTGNGKHSYSLFDFYFDDREELVKVWDERKAKEWFPRLHNLDSRHKLAVEQNDQAYLRQHNVFLSNAGTEVKNYVGANRAWALPALLFLVGAPALTAGLVWGAQRINHNISDNEDWNAAQKADNAAAFRNYLIAQPNGLHTFEANQKIDEQYDQAAQKYAGRQKDAGDSAAAQAILQMLKHAKTNRQPVVQVLFERHNDLNDELVAKVKKEQYEDDLVSIGNDFSTEKMKEREKSIVTAIELAFKQIIPTDLLTFTIAETKNAELPALFIAYHIIPDGTIYHKPSRRYYGPNQSFLGFTMNWNCELTTPGVAEPYRFALNSNPSSFFNTIIYENGEQDLTKFSTYEILTGSAFGDFGKNLANEFGLGEEPLKKAETTEVPPKKLNKRR